MPDYRAVPRRLQAAKTATDRLTLLEQTFKFDYVKVVEFGQE